MSMQEPPVTGAKGATCKRTDGQPCNRYPVAGSTLCETHLFNPKARANARMRAAVAKFSPDVEPVEAGIVLLRMLAYAADRQRDYASLLARQHAELGPDPTLAEEIAAAVYDTYAEGSKTGEQVRALVKWEAHWLSETARLAKLALDAGIAERQVRLAEDQGALVFAALKMFTLALGHEWDTSTRNLANRALLAIEEGA